MPSTLPTEPIIYDRYPIWDKQKEERTDWYDCFCRHYLPNPKPSANKAYFAWYAAVNQFNNSETKTPARVNDTWQKVVKIFRWKERHEAYWVARNKENLSFIEHRRRMLQEKIFKLAEQSIDKASEMLTHPTRFTQVAKTDEQGRPIIYNVYPTENWSLKDATKMVIEASQLMNFADEIIPEDVAIDLLLKKGFEVSNPAFRLVEEQHQKGIKPSNQAMLMADDATIDAIIEEESDNL